MDVRVLAATAPTSSGRAAANVCEDPLSAQRGARPRAPRRRREDVRLLVDHFIAKISRECHREVRGISAGALDTLVGYDWPGNVRELENVIHRAVVLARGPVLPLQDFPLDVAMPATGTRLAEDTGLPLAAARDQFERQYVLRVLEQVGWNVSRAARTLGVHRNTVLAKLAVWGVHRPGSDGRAVSI
jgi:DNA-binding NtrC family response regulator